MKRLLPLVLALALVGACAAAESDAAERLGGGGGSTGTVGYVGCSNTQMSVEGYQGVGGQNMWPANQAYNGGTVHVWATEGDAGPHWAAFQQMLNTHPQTTTVWFEGCQKSTENDSLSFSEGQAVIAEVLSRAPGVTIYFSAMNDYSDHVCPICGADGPAHMRALRDQLVAAGNALLGPEMGALNLQQVQSDLCHPNRLGKPYEGNFLKAFFG